MIGSLQFIYSFWLRLGGRSMLFQIRICMSISIRIRATINLSNSISIIIVIRELLSRPKQGSYDLSRSKHAIRVFSTESNMFI